MAQFGDKLAQMGIAHKLGKQGGRTMDPMVSEKIHDARREKERKAMVSTKIHDKHRAEERKEFQEETQGEAIGRKWKKQRDKDKSYFGAIDIQNEKQFRAPAIGTKSRGFGGGDHGTDSDSDLDSDDRAMLNDPELDTIQRNRLAKLKKEFEITKALKATGHGTYDDLRDEEMLKMTAETDYVVCAFYHKDFERCKIIDKHLRDLSKKHLSARFIRMDVQKSPFMAHKMLIKTLPSICCFIDAVLVDKVIGFDDFGGKDDFHTVILENRLVKSGVIPDKHGRRARKSKKTQSFLDNIGKREFYCDDELDM